MAKKKSSKKNSKKEKPQKKSSKEPAGEAKQEALPMDRILQVTAVVVIIIAVVIGLYLMGKDNEEPPILQLEEEDTPEQVVPPQEPVPIDFSSILENAGEAGQIITVKGFIQREQNDRSYATFLVDDYDNSFSLVLQDDAQRQMVANSTPDQIYMVQGVLRKRTRPILTVTLLEESQRDYQ